MLDVGSELGPVVVLEGLGELPEHALTEEDTNQRSGISDIEKRSLLEAQSLFGSLAGVAVANHFACSQDVNVI